MCEGIMARKGSTQIAKELNDAGYRNTVGKKCGNLWIFLSLCMTAKMLAL